MNTDVPLPFKYKRRDCVRLWLVGTWFAIVVYQPANGLSVSRRRRQRQQPKTFRIPIHLTLCTPTKDDISILLDSEFPSKFECHSCHEQFSSRNALFRHLRSSVECGTHNDAKIGQRLWKQSIAFQFGYFGTKEHSYVHSMALEAGTIVQQAVLEILQKRCDPLRDGVHSVELSSGTQSSLARLRPEVLGPDFDMASVGDVLVMTVRIPETCRAWALTPAATDSPSPFLCAIQENIHQRQPSTIKIVVQAAKFLDDDMPLHAERSCTQMAYQYLLPLEWLPQGDLLLLDWNNTSTPPPTESLRLLKKALRSTESARRQQSPSSLELVEEKEQETVGANVRFARGRFGALAQRERRTWHNYSTKRVSPNHDTAWRVVDRCRIVGFDSGHAIIEVRGDDLLQGQVRAIVGTAVAMANGWLPLDTVARTTTKEYVLAMPMAPPNRGYLSDVKFHFEEMRTGGRQLFQSPIGGPVLRRNAPTTVPIADLVRSAIIQRHTSNRIDEIEWLQDLQRRIAPAVLSSMEHMTSRFKAMPSFNTSGKVPPEYNRVLEELLLIVESGSWPETTTARQDVIRKVEEKAVTGRRRGSFTIVNPEHPASKLVDAPLGNNKFPELVRAVFDLELKLSEMGSLCVFEDMRELHSSQSRPASSHCAVNCDAQFTPHVDSGRGMGQQLSMIVGLGYYSGGELFVEQKSYDIRYQPLQFDGWKLRHWTAPFDGQRFSLVWFTPELEQMRLL